VALRAAGPTYRFVRFASPIGQTERDELKALLRGGRHAARMLTCTDLLAADAGVSDGETATSVAVAGTTVYRTKRRFATGTWRRRSMRSRALEGTAGSSGKEEALLVATACSNPPEGRARWALEPAADELVSLTEHNNVSRESVRRRLKENELKPWRKDI
jgi:hypothetical protein